jgi:phospholipase/carboxylesterase
VDFNPHVLYLSYNKGNYLMHVEAVRLGGLPCLVVDALPAGTSPALGVVLCHGFGAPGNDLAALGPELIRMEPQLAPSVRFYFPEGPLSLDSLGMYGGRAWWLLNVEQLVAAVERGEFRDLRNDHPAGLQEARELLTSCLDAICETDGLPAERLVLGGFSQGSMLATDVALRLPGRPAGLCVLSGTLLCEDQWRELILRRGPLPVLQSHGRQDQILPFAAAEWLRELLEAGGLPVEFLPFDGVHTISPATLQRLAEFLVARLPATSEN